MIRIRPADAEETDRLVRSSWVETFSRVRPSGIAEWCWYDMHRAYVGKLLETSTVDVAELDSVPGEALGWVCYEPDRGKHRAAIHYVCVKTKYMHNGIGRKLLDHAIEKCGADPQMTHLTAAGRRLIGRTR